MVKGEQKSSGESKKYVGFTQVEVRAVNPSRKELNKLLEREDEDDDKEIVYLGEDKEHNTRVRLSFWLYDPILNKYFVHSFNVTDKERISNDETKNQYINNVLTTAWADTEENLPSWFTEFQDKEKKKLGDKTFRKANFGEDELAVFVRAWLGKVNYSKPSADVTIDPKRLFKEDYTELRELIDSSYAKPFVALLGVRTDENDATKQYQQVYGKGFLPNGFMKYVKNGFSFKKDQDYDKRIWTKFEKDVTGEYGFDAYYDLVPLKEYDANEDVATSTSTKNEAKAVTKTNANY